MPNPAAQAHLDAANEAMRSHDFAGAADALAKAYAEDPDDFEVNYQFIRMYPARHYVFDGRQMKATDEALAAADAERFRTEMAATYEQRAGEEPANAMWPYLLAQLAGRDAVAVERHLAAALAADPGFARTYNDLALLCQKKGDNAGHLANLRTAAELAPDDGDAAFQYAYAVRGAALLAFAERFPDHLRAAQALTEAAGDVDHEDEALALLERAASLDDGGRGMAAYARVQFMQRLAGRDVARAATQAEAFGPQFAGMATALRAMADAEAALAAGDGAGAVAALDAVPAGSTFGRAYRLRVEAHLAAGDGPAARALLIERLTADPDPALWELASAVGDIDEVAAEVWAARDAAATVAPDFEAVTPDGRRVGLAEQRGGVVLLNLWYPGCGPCRNEFRFLAPIVRRFAGRPFEVIAVNTVVAEDELVAPFMAGNDYPFTATRAGLDVAEAYGVNATPANFLIDHEGRVQFRPGVHDRDSAERLAAMIEEVVGRAEAAGA
jgi:thiol-disulfide isomerase/thioredoxin